jgi:hypothetical protein
MICIIETWHAEASVRVDVLVISLHISEKSARHFLDDCDKRKSLISDILAVASTMSVSWFSGTNSDMSCSGMSLSSFPDPPTLSSVSLNSASDDVRGLPLVLSLWTSKKVVQKEKKIRNKVQARR